jgi:hypothetical protein
MSDPGTPPLSPTASAIIAAASYERLTVSGATPPAARELLGGVALQQLLSSPIADAPAARAMLAGLWLRHDALDESHNISQSLATPDGSFWHAIMHRREGDFSNAKYWYARCRHHPVLEQIPALARATLGEAARGALHGVIDRGAWDPDAFVDAVEATHRDPDDPLHAAAVRLQQVEWRALFDSCLRAAAGRR